MKFLAKSPSSNRNRKRKVIWFNPPFNEDVDTNIGKSFIKLVKKHFPKEHVYSKIFNSFNIKISYCCTTNMQNSIKQHNSKILKPHKEPSRYCDCRDKTSCPLNEECLTECIVYKALVKAGTKEYTYYGCCEGSFKERYRNHKSSFNLKKHHSKTALSSQIWKLKEEGTSFNISWSIEKRSFPYKCGTRRCDLCLSEKVSIMRAEPKGLLNKRTELLDKCRHRNKFLLCNLKPI